MKALLCWLKKVIVSLARFFIAIFSWIVDVLESDQPSDESQPKGHLIKSLVVSVNDDGLIFLKAVNGVPWSKHHNRNQPVNADCQDDTAQAGAKTMQFAAGNVVQFGSDCYLIKPEIVGHSCTQVPCPV